MSTPQQPPTKKERRDAARAEREAAEREQAAAAQRKKRLAIILGAVAAAAVIAIVLIATTSSGNEAADKAASSGKASGGADVAAEFAGIPQAGINLGNPNAKVQVIEFLDPQCPICKQFNNNVFPTINQDYIRTGKVYYQTRTLTFIGPDSVRGADFLNAAGLQNKQANATALLYRNQGQENSGYMTDDFLRSIGNAIPGFNTQQAMTDRNLPKVQALRPAADALGTKYNVTGTPTLVIGKNGGTLTKVNAPNLTLDEYTSAIEAALKINK